MSPGRLKQSEGDDELLGKSLVWLTAKDLDAESVGMPWTAG